MGRDYTVREFEEISFWPLRRKYPDISIATDFIVGFPGETDEDFSRSLALVGRLKSAKVNVTRYSQRPFTGPFEKKDFPDSVKEDRSRLSMHMRKNSIALSTSLFLERQFPAS